jgi:hypothetical protein
MVWPINGKTPSVPDHSRSDAQASQRAGYITGQNDKYPTPKPFPPNQTSQNPRPRSHERRVTQPGKIRDPGLTASQQSCSLKSHRQSDTPTLIPLFQLTHLPECQPTQPIGIPPARNADARAPLRRANAEIACKPCRCFVAPNVCIASRGPQAKTRRIRSGSFSKASRHSILATL